MGREIKYPVRCKIIDASGAVIDPEHPNIVAATPYESMQHIGKTGLAELLMGLEEDPWGFGLVRITLDDGNIIWGYECWWTPLEDE